MLHAYQKNFISTVLVFQDQPLITRTPHHRLHAESVGTVIAQSHASLGTSHGTSLGAVDFFDMTSSPSMLCHTCSSLSRHGRQGGNKHHQQVHIRDVTTKIDQVERSDLDLNLIIYCIINTPVYKAQNYISFTPLNVYTQFHVELF